MTGSGTAMSPRGEGTGLTVRDKRDGLRTKLSEFEPSFQSLLPKRYPVEELVTGAMVATTLEPKLLECDPLSFATAVARIAQWGLTIGVTAHLVPFWNDKQKKLICTPVADYKGYIELMCAAGVRKVEAEVVLEGEDFSWERGTNPHIVHRPGCRLDPRPITHAYAVAWLRGMIPQFEIMTVDEINAIRKTSKQWSGGALPIWYARKTVIRRLRKYVPTTPRLQALFQSPDPDLDELEPTAAAEPVAPVGPAVSPGATAPARLASARVATDDQLDLIRQILRDEVFTDADRQVVEDSIAGGLSFVQAGALADQYFDKARARRGTGDGAEPGDAQEDPL